MARRLTRTESQERREPSIGARRISFDVYAQPRDARPPPPPQSRRPRRGGRILFGLAKWLTILGIWAGVALGGAVAWYAYDLPDIGGIHVFNRRPSLTFLAADGQVLAAYGDLHGGVVELRDMPPHLPRAVLAIEDRRFYGHFGIDPRGVLRAIYVNLREGRVVQGGSTITQQLAKNVFLSNERSFRRKMQETLLALWIERRFSKDEILTLYLNRVYLGGGAYGVEAAAKRYFAKSARQVTLKEAAILAGLLKAPSRYAPTADPQRARERANLVLASMVDAEFITPRQAEVAEGAPLVLAADIANGRQGRYFTDWLLDQVPSFVGFVDRDLMITTTLDPRLQELAESAVAGAIAGDGAKARFEQAALVALGTDGAVRAMVGGRSYAESQFNRAATALRQPGSAFKPFVYLAAVEAGLHPDDRLSDAPVNIGSWSPRNFDNRQRGDITAREALARSVNTATVRVAQQTGVDRIIAVARRLGITTDLRRDLAISLGASEVTLLELTAAFAPYASGGTGAWPYAIAEIRDARGGVVYRRSGSGPGRIIQNEPMRAMTDMLTAVIAQGTGRAAMLDRPAGGKTGTSQDFRDAWFVGFTADLVAGVWVGNDDRDPMNAVTGGSVPARLWKAFMLPAHRGLPPRPLPGTVLPPAAGTPIATFDPLGRTPRPVPAPAYAAPPGPAPMPLDPSAGRPHDNQLR